MRKRGWERWRDAPRSIGSQPARIAIAIATITRLAGRRLPLMKPWIKLSFMRVNMSTQTSVMTTTTKNAPIAYLPSAIGRCTGGRSSFSGIHVAGRRGLARCVITPDSSPADVAVDAMIPIPSWTYLKALAATLRCICLVESEISTDSKPGPRRRQRTASVASPRILQGSACNKLYLLRCRTAIPITKIMIVPSSPCWIRTNTLMYAKDGKPHVLNPSFAVHCNDVSRYNVPELRNCTAIRIA